MLICRLLNSFYIITDVSLQTDEEKQEIKENNPGLYIPDLKYNMRNSTKVCFYSPTILEKKTWRAQLFLGAFMEYSKRNNLV